MDFYYDVGLTLLRKGKEVGGYDIADACTEMIEMAMEEWAAAFGIRKTNLLLAVWEGERMVFAEAEESEESEEEEGEKNSEEEEEEEDSAEEVGEEEG